MKKFPPVKLIATIALVSLSLSSCEKLFNKSPEVNDQTFSVAENSPNGTVVGQIVAEDKSGQELFYYIVDGNEEDIFAVNEKTGDISVNNSALLDYESYESISFTAEVKDEFGKWDECKITVNLEDVKPTTDHLLSYYKFNDNGNDETGYSNATVTNGQYITDLTFNSGKVLYLNGSAYADLNTGFDYSNRSISIWFNVSEISSEMNVIIASDYQNYEYGLSSMAVQSVAGTEKLVFNLSNNPVYTAISKNEWHNAVMVLDNTSYTYYLDGEVKGYGPITSYITSNLGYQNTVIGISRNFDRNVYGMLAEARFYTKALTAEEV